MPANVLHALLNLKFYGQKQDYFFKIDGLRGRCVGINGLKEKLAVGYLDTCPQRRGL